MVRVVGLSSLGFRSCNCRVLDMLERGSCDTPQSGTRAEPVPICSQNELSPDGSAVDGQMMTRRAGKASVSPAYLSG